MDIIGGIIDSGTAYAVEVAMLSVEFVDEVGHGAVIGNEGDFVFLDAPGAVFLHLALVGVVHGGVGAVGSEGNLGGLTLPESGVGLGTIVVNGMGYGRLVLIPSADDEFLKVLLAPGEAEGQSSNNHRHDGLQCLFHYFDAFNRLID